MQIIKSLLPALLYLLLSSNVYAVNSTGKEAPPTLSTQLRHYFQQRIVKKHPTKQFNNRKEKKAKRKAERKDPILKWRRFAVDFLLLALATLVGGYALVIILILNTGEVSDFAAVIVYALSFLLSIIFTLCATFSLIMWLIKRNK